MTIILKKGQGIVEYALILVFVAVVVMTAVYLLGNPIAQIYSNILLSI